MKKIIYSLIIIMLPNIADATQYACRVTNTFQDTCPSARDLGWGITAEEPTCVCSRPPSVICRMTDTYDGKCPTNYYGADNLQCQCTSGERGDVNPDSGAPVYPEGGGGGGRSHKHKQRTAKEVVSGSGAEVINGSQWGCTGRAAQSL